jgi:hypothetical protein
MIYLGSESILFSKFGTILTFPEQQKLNKMTVTCEHPKICELAYKLETNKFSNANQMTIEMLTALRSWVNDFSLKFWGNQLRKFLESWMKMCNGIRRTNRLHAGALNALDEITPKVEKMVENNSLEELKGKLNEIISNYIEEKIVFAQELMVKNGMSLLE